MVDLENGPSEHDWLDHIPDPDPREEDCPDHGCQRVLDTGTTGGSDPWSTDKLECGCEILDMGVGDEHVQVIRRWR